MKLFHRHREATSELAPAVEPSDGFLPPSPITGHALSLADAAKGGRRSAITIAARKAERAALYAAGDRVVAAVKEGEIGQGALETAMLTMERMQDAIPDVPITTMRDAVNGAQVVETLHKVHRLATGQSTANVAHAVLSEEERAARVAAASERLALLQSVELPTTPAATLRSEPR